MRKTSARRTELELIILIAFHSVHQMHRFEANILTDAAAIWIISKIIFCWSYTS
jgi:hypothetical protein